MVRLQRQQVGLERVDLRRPDGCAPAARARAAGSPGSTGRRGTRRSCRPARRRWAARGWRRRRRGPRTASGSSGCSSGSAVGQFTSATGADVPRSASAVAVSSSRAAIHRSVGLASGVLAKYRPSCAGAAGLDLVGAQGRDGVPLDADQPGRGPARDVGGPLPLGPARRLGPLEVAVHGRHGGHHLVLHGGGDGLVVEGLVRPARTTRPAGTRPARGTAARRGARRCTRRARRRTPAGGSCRSAPPARPGRPSSRTSAGSPRPRSRARPAGARGWCSRGSPRAGSRRRRPRCAARSPPGRRWRTTRRPSTVTGAGAQDGPAGAGSSVGPGSSDGSSEHPVRSTTRGSTTATAGTRVVHRSGRRPRSVVATFVDSHR